LVSNARWLIGAGSAHAWWCCLMRTHACRTSRPVSKSVCPIKQFGNGDVDGMPGICLSMTDRGAGESPSFPPADEAEVKAIACELTSESDEPLSRRFTSDVTRRVNSVRQKKRPISRSSVARILRRAALKPWQFRYWIFPRDERFAEKAARILDLYAGQWDGKPLGENEFVISADEKTSIQARRRCHASVPPREGQPMRVEPEYERGGALQYLAAWDVFRGMVMGRCEPKSGIVPFGRLVDQVMAQEPYRSADRVFWIVDNGSSHRGAKCVARLQEKYPRLVAVHGPVHASWLNQIEIYFSIVQRKVLTPNDFPSLAAVEERLLAFQDYYEAIAQPFAWTFTRRDLAALLNKIAPASDLPLRLAA